MKIQHLFITTLAITLFSIPAHPQNKPENTKPFLSYFFDSPVSKIPYGEGSISIENYEYGNILGINVAGGYSITDLIELQIDWGFSNLSPEEGDGQSGIRDLGVYGRYNILSEEEGNLSAGGYISLPIGSEDIGGGKLNLGGFAAGRYFLENGAIITGNFGLIAVEITEIGEGSFDPESMTYEPGEEETSHELSVRLGGGCIYPINEKLNFIGELAIQTKYDYMIIGGGMDYALGSGKVRAMLGLGLDDGAPDFMVRGGYEISLSGI